MIKKYWAVFRISWQRELEYRWLFFINRVKSVVVILMLYYVWVNLAQKSGRFASFSFEEIITYVFLVNIIRSVVFGAQTRQIVIEINNGWFSKYLVSPVSHFWYEFFRQLAERTIYLISSLIEIAVLFYILQVQVIWQSDFKLVLLSLFASLLAIFLYYQLTYIVSLLAFWSRESLGPRFLFEWTLEFASGAFFPLNILSSGVFLFLHFLPFAYLVYVPIMIYLGKLQFYQSVGLIIVEILWIGAVMWLYKVVWNKGMKNFSGEGI